MAGVSFDLHGRTALITGGTRGIGRALAEGVGAAGARVVITGRTKEGVDEAVDGLRALEIDATGVAWDVTEHERAQEIVDAVLAEHGALDIVINNAGIIERAPAAEFPLETWQRVLTTNLTGAFALSQAAGRKMIDRGYGRIINMASVLGFSGGRNVVAYTTAKGGLIQLTRSLAAEWSRHGVTVNAIAAGYIATDLTAELRADPDRAQDLLSRIPAGRWGTGEDLVGATVFLSSDASSYVTGSVLAVDGGWMAA
ncbi:MAG TPA: glucose 1-dehydrogenase [Kutzneria sp.]|jgi:2-deoxy-D-gluconate 3-dehydrogenase